jgi:hypothetical protein
VLADVSSPDRDFLLKEKGDKVDITVKSKRVVTGKVGARAGTSHTSLQVICLYFADIRNQVINGTVASLLPAPPTLCTGHHARDRERLRKRAADGATQPASPAHRCCRGRTWK